MKLICSPKMKRMICLLLTFTMFCSLLGINVFAASETTWYATQYSGASGNATWKIMKATNAELVNNVFDDERLVISGTGEMKDYTSYTNGYTTSPWTYYSWTINSIIVEEGITRIGNNAFLGDFSGCVCRISLPSTLESIGEFAFALSLNYVKELIIPNNVTLLGKCAFTGIGVETVTIPGSISYIPEQAFASCDNLKSVTMLEGVTRIGPDAFDNNEKLESVTIPASVTQIDHYAFGFCENLKTIHYKGTPEQWEEITIAAGNNDLLNATVNFPKIEVESISLDKTTKTLFVGSAFTLTATVMPENAFDKRVTWKSSNTSVATVADGVVTAKAAGTAKITATTVDGAKVASCTVSVQQAPNIAVTGVSLNKSSTNLSVGETETLTATITPSNATDKSVAWSSSNSNIASISSSGVVTAKAAGTAKITVKTTDGNWTASCDVTVKNNVITVTSISLNRTFANLEIGETETLVATVYPTNATNKNVTWESSNTSVATVSNGAVTAKAAGSATISATTADGNKVATCDVVVTDPNAPVTAKFQFSNVSGRPGEIVKMKLSLKTEEEINSIAVSGFSYDTSVLTFAGFSDYEHIEELTVLPPTFDDDKKAVVIGLKEAAIFDDDICMLNFKIKDGADEGACNISASSVVKLYSNVVQSSVTPGTLSISMQLLGDIDCNEKVDISDAIALFQYSMLPDLYPISYIGNIDFDKNGTVDIGDAVLLFQYSMLPDLYPIE